MKAKNYLNVILLSVFTIYSVSAREDIDSEKASNEKQESRGTIIESLENGESYSIEITSINCFNGTRQTILVTREADEFIAIFQDVSVFLSEADIQAFINFERKLGNLERGGCSTVDTYILRFKGAVLKTSDGTCSWNGGKKLLQVIS